MATHVHPNHCHLLQKLDAGGATTTLRDVVEGGLKKVNVHAISAQKERARKILSPVEVELPFEPNSLPKHIVCACLAVRRSQYRKHASVLYLILDSSPR